MSSKSIDAYDVAERVAAYDYSMDIMHPNRHKMADVALEVLPVSRSAELRILDIGSGTGFLLEKFLTSFPNSTAVAVDGASAMADVANERLDSQATRVDYRIGDFRELKGIVADAGPFDLVISAYALHHLDPEEKCRLLTDVIDLMTPGAWFVNADVVMGGTELLETRFQELRVAGIVERAAGEDDRYRDELATRRNLDAMEADEGDQPQTLATDLGVLKAAGLKDTGVFWLEYREAVTGGRRP